MDPIINGLFVCESSSEGHAVLANPGGNVELSGPAADKVTKGEQYEITVVYVGDKPPHP